MKLTHFFRPLKITALTAVFVLFNQCARNPVTGKRQIVLMSESQEIAMGVSSNPQVLAEFGEYPDSNLQRYINDIGQRMAKISHRPNLEFHFKVVDSDVVNAFAIPGGYVYFTRGILAYFNNEAQLAGVLGHEIGHVTARHGVSQQTKQMGGQLILIGAMIASPKLAQFGEQLSQGMQLLFLKFSRDDESQSDELGVAYSSKIGFDAQHMATFFLTLNRLGGGDESTERIPTFMSTHPDPVDRNKKVQAMALDFQAKNPGNFLVNRDGYLRLIDGIIYGEDPNQGFVENMVFYHPQLKFQFPIPSNWKYQNSPAQFQMASPDQKALMIMTLAPEKTLGEAATNFAQKNKLSVLSQQNTTINGLPAIVQVADQVADAQAQQLQQQQSMQPTRQQMEKTPSTKQSPQPKQTPEAPKMPQQGQNPQQAPQPQQSPQQIPQSSPQPSQAQPSQQTQQATGVRIVTTFIQYNGMIYMIHGVSEAKDFATYESTFGSTMRNFKVLTDPSKLNVKPERIRIQTTYSEATLAEILRGYGTPEKRLKELAIVNGMELTDRVPRGTLIKTVVK